MSSRDLTELPGVGPSLARRLEQSGLSQVEQVAAAEPQDLSKIRGISVALANSLRRAARQLLDASATTNEDSAETATSDRPKPKAGQLAAAPPLPKSRTAGELYFLGDRGTEVLQLLQKRLRLSRQSTPSRRCAYLDTFDWRIYGLGCMLTVESDGQEAATLHCRGLQGESQANHLLPSAESSNSSSAPAFAQELPSEGPWPRLAKAMSMRRLLTRAEASWSGEYMALQDKEGKTRARLWLEEGQVRQPGRRGSSSTGQVLRLAGIKGYDRDLAKVRKLLQQDLGLALTDQTELHMVMAAVGASPGDYSSKLQLHLDGELRAEEVLRHVLRELLTTMRRNEDGTRKDVDSEFLHDFRVAVRRSRSVLSQLKGVLPAEALEPMRQELNWLGRISGPTRDLDVYLLKMPSYGAALPEDARQDLQPLSIFLAQRQRQEQKRLARFLASRRYRDFTAAWEAFLSTPVADEQAPEAGRKVSVVAGQRLRKVWKRVIKEGSRITTESPAEALHDLRIRCKKLRYMLEIFRSLYLPKLIDPVIRELKRLQDNLGDFNDYEVQRLALAGFAQEMAKAGSAPTETLLAMGRLMERLEQGQDAERERFHQRFARFAAEENQIRFARLVSET